MATIKRFEELDCWQNAREITRRIYQLSAKGPLSRDFGLRDQMRRAGVSVMSNIAEGFESRTRPLFIEFLGRAKGSAGELRAQLFVALDAGYLDQAEFDDLRGKAARISAQISNLSSYLQSLPDATHVSEESPPYEIPTF